MPHPRYRFAAVTAPNGRIYTFGGSDPTDANADTSLVLEYDPDTDSWATRTPMLKGRVAHSASLGDDGRIYVFGGVAGGGLDSVDVYDPTTDSWSVGPVMLGLRYSIGAATAGNGKIYVVGGVYDGSETDTSRLEELGPGGGAQDTKADVLGASGVPGKGLDTAPGLDKPFNPKSKAAENAGKKS
jgi:N-acetylneuraminic acid mutarotase